MSGKDDLEAPTPGPAADERLGAPEKAERELSKRPLAAVIAAVPIVLVNTLAVIGQCQWAATHLHWGRPGQALFAGALETTALAVMYLAHTALIEGDSAWRQKVFAYGIAGGSASVNWQEHSNAWHPTPPAFVFAGASLLSPILWATYSRFAARVVMREAGLIDRRAAKFSFARWLMFPRRTFKALRYSVWFSVQSPAKAIAASQQLADVNGNRSANADKPKTVKRDRKAVNGPADRQTATEPSTVNEPNAIVEPTDNRADNDNPAGREPGVDNRANDKPRDRQKAAVKQTPAGQPSTDTWVLIGKPVYEQLRAENGKRPSETVFHAALAALVARLIADGELVGENKDEKPDAYADPSLSTAKRIRGEIEGRFPGIVFGHHVPDQLTDAAEEVA